MKKKLPYKYRNGRLIRGLYTWKELVDLYMKNGFKYYYNKLK